jgi:hypothetical protein
VDDASSDSTEPMSDLSHINDTLEDKDNHDKERPTKVFKKDSGMGSALTDTTEDMGPSQDNVYLSTSEDEPSINKQGTIRKDVIVKKPTKTSVFDLSAPLPSYFKHVRAALYGHFDSAMKTLLYRYVAAYSGYLYLPSPSFPPRRCFWFSYCATEK